MNKENIKIGFIGFGEVANILAKGFSENGVENIFVYDKLLDNPNFEGTIRSKAKRLNVLVEEKIEDIVKKANLLFITVPANKTFEVFESIFDHLHSNQVYIDLTATTPKVKKNIAEELEKKEIPLIDGAIMGPVVAEGYKVPILLSGAKVKETEELLNDLNMNTKAINESVGSSSAIKLIRSIYMKGISGLFTEMLEASEHYNVSEDVISSIEKTLRNRTFEETLNRLVTSNAIHSGRRAAELEGTIELLKESNLDYKMTEATKLKLLDITNENLKNEFNNETPKEWIQVINKLK